MTDSGLQTSPGKLAGIGSALLFAVAALGASAQPRFTVSADGGEVADAKTGLVWRRCSAGQSFNGSTCSGVANVFSHRQALSYAQTQPGWRLPNVKELFSIVDSNSETLPAEPRLFPGAPSGSFWTSTPLADDPRFAWGVNLFYGGEVIQYDRWVGHHVRLVRSS